MKKATMFLAALATAGVAFAEGIAPIEGDNEVGFATLSAPANSKTIITVPFEACMGGGATGTLAQVVSTSGLTSHADTPGSADQLIVLDKATVGEEPNVPVYYYYWNKTGDGWTALETTRYSTGGVLETINPPSPSSYPIARGMGIWLKRVAGSGTVFLTGQVPGAVKQATSITPGLNLVGAGKVEAYNLNDLDWEGAIGGKSAANADMILAVNENGSLSQYFYFVDTANWGGSYTALSGKWVTQTYSPNITIPAGQGFWYRRRGETSFTFRPEGN